MRLDKPPTAGPDREPEPDERAVVAWVADMGCALSSQVHAQFGQGRSLSTTQRQLRRLWEAGWLARFALHGSDGGTPPLAYAPLALDLREPEALLAARRAIHATAWIQALDRAIGGKVLRSQGRERSQLRPALPGRDRIGALRATELGLPPGRHLHGLLPERFDPVRPDATLQVQPAAGARVELLLDFEERPGSAPSARKLERYDHLLGGWCTTLARYRQAGPPLVVVICPDRDSARDLCRLADPLLTCAHAHARERPEDWPYPGRARLLFAAEPDIHLGLPRALRVPALPPEVRARPRVGGSRAFEPLAVALPG